MEGPLGWRRRLLFTAILAGVALLSVEIPLQLYYRFTAGDWLVRRTLPPIYEADPTRCYRVKPDLDYLHQTNEFQNRIFTNAQSFRSDARREPVTFEKPADVYRVLFLGPSFTFGWGSDYADTYAARIASALRVPGKRVELLNLGTPAQAVAPQLCWLAKEGWRYQPDLVVQTSYGERLAPMPPGCPEDLGCPFVEDSHVYFLRPTPKQRAIAKVKNFATVFYGFYVYNMVFAETAKPGVGTGKELYADEPQPTGDDREGLVKGYQKFVDFVRARVGAQTQVSFVHIPFSFLVHEGDRARWKHIIDVEPRAAQARTRADIAALKAAGLSVIDTLDPLIERGERERQFFWLDIHLTPEGNATVAEAALPVLQALVLGDGTPSPIVAR